MTVVSAPGDAVAAFDRRFADVVAAGPACFIGAAALSALALVRQRRLRVGVAIGTVDHPCPPMEPGG
jgi:hypothetical protein